MDHRQMWSQTVKVPSTIDYHEVFEQAQSEWQFMIVYDRAW